jgi:hypothetical protein
MYFQDTSRKSSNGSSYFRRKKSALHNSLKISLIFQPFSVQKARGCRGNIGWFINLHCTVKGEKTENFPTFP